MLNVKKHVRGLLVANSALVAALGSADKITAGFPNIAADVPCVTFKELNQRSTDDSYYDDFSTGKESEIEIHTWTSIDVSTTNIASLIDSIMEANLWNIDFSGDFDEPENRILHRVARYSRKFVTGEIT